MMKSFISKVGLIAFLVCQSLASFADYRDEIRRLARIDLLPEFDKGDVVKQLSSYDTTGGNDDGFSGRFSFLRKEKGNFVIADLKGSGVIQRIWTPTPTDDTLQFYFDGEATPRIEIKFIDLFSGKKYPFLRPVVGNEVGGYYCYLPIPYAKSCKIVYKGKRMQFYQIQYRELGSGKEISSFPKKFSNEEDEALSSVISLWKKSGTNIISALPVSQGKISSVTKTVVLKPGDRASVFSSNSAGRILGIELRPQIQLSDQFKDLMLVAKWDKDGAPAINCPVTGFFGYAFGKPAMQSLLIGVREGVHYCYMPMPFSTGADIELKYYKSPLNKSAEIPVNVTIYYSNKGLSEEEGKFYTAWRRETDPKMGQPYQILSRSGRGHYVGTLLQAQGINPGMTLFFEGDDQCYVDGELRLHGTGSEDYFNGGWYALPDRWDQSFSLPLHGCLAYSVPLARTGGYRFMLSDKISFESDIRLTIEHGPEKNKIPVDYTSVAFYYCDTPPVSNDLPPQELLKKVETPNLLEYWIALLPVKAISSGTSILHTKCKDETTGQNYDVLQLEAGDNGFAKFELEVPSSGDYKLYLSYFKGPVNCQFTVNQRQIPISGTLDGYASKNTLVEKQLIGTLSIKEGTNTVTIQLKHRNEKAGVNKFLLHRLYLEKLF